METRKFGFIATEKDCHIFFTQKMEIVLGCHRASEYLCKSVNKRVQRQLYFNTDIQNFHPPHSINS